jgi:hypothetical protein
MGYMTQERHPEIKPLVGPPVHGGAVGDNVERGIRLSSSLNSTEKGGYPSFTTSYGPLESS